jgi:hypothetical protein
MLQVRNTLKYFRKRISKSCVSCHLLSPGEVTVLFVSLQENSIQLQFLCHEVIPATFYLRHFSAFDRKCCKYAPISFARLTAYNEARIGEALNLILASFIKICRYVPVLVKIVQQKWTLHEDLQSLGLHRTSRA